MTEPDSGPSTTTTRPGPFEDVLPLSPLQEGMLFHATFDEDALDPYTVRLAVDLDGPFDADAFRAAVTAVLRRHGNLRAGFRHEGLSRPVQLVPRAWEAPVAVVDVSTSDDVAAALAEVTAAEAAVRFDLTKPPLLRFTVVRAGERTHRLLFTAHHILLDGWSMPLLLGELFELYRRRGDDTDMAAVPPFRTFLAWLKRQDRSAALAAWRAELSGLDGPTLLVPGPVPATALPAEHRVEVGAALTERVRELARRCGVTVNAVLQAGWAVVLAGVTGRDDVVFGTTVSGRPPELPGVESMIGLFINTQPVRVRLDPAETVGALLARIRESQAGLLAHQHVGLTDVQRAAGHGELFDSLVVYENYPLDADSVGGALGDLTVTGVSAGDATHYPLLISAGMGEALWLRLSYRADLFAAEEVEAIAERLLRVFEAADADLPVARLDVLSTAERERALVRWNDSAMPAATATLVELFGAQAARTPDAVAIVAEDSTLTYAELDGAANRLARLLAARGAGPGTVVALAMPSSAKLLASLFAVLRTGAAYLPVDPGLPAERIAFLLADSAPLLVLTDLETRPALPPVDIEVLALDEEGTWGEIVGYTDAPLDTPGPRMSDAAYVIYTSGSTGTPKGVVVEHRALAEYLAWTRSRYPAAAGVALLHSPVSFDLTITALCTPLTVGGRLHVADLKAAGSDAVGELADHPVTFLKATPSHLPLLTALPDEFSPSGQLLLGGEALHGELLSEWRQRHPDAVVLNVYGPTEATVNCAEHVIEPGAPVPPGPVPIGRPQGNARLYVLDSALRPVLPGVVGDLHIAGTGLARGYLNRPGLTAERFVADPYGPGRMYRTGDLARWTVDGELVFCGRADGQVKLRGHRVELGEIESALLALPGVDRAAAVVRAGDGAGDVRLVAYLVGEDVDTTAVRPALAATLPDYMVPGAVVVLEALPLTPNGKLDQAALPSPEFTARAGGRAPRAPREEILCGLFTEVLGVAGVTIDDDFFDLGGHSLLATRLVSRIRSTLGVELSVRALFEAPTVAGVAARLDSAADARQAPRPMPRPERVPLSAAQRRLWFLDRFEPDGPTYNVPIAVRLRGELDRGALLAALGDVAARHESLRTVFPEVDGAPVQRVRDDVEPDVAVVPADESTVDELVDAESRRGFDLTAEPPMRARLFALSETEHVLLVVLHHIVSDAWSRAPLARDIGVAYLARRAGAEPRWTPLPVQYADYTLWQDEVLGAEDDPDSAIARQIAYWKQALAGLPDELALPADRQRPAVAGHRGDLVELDIDPALHQALLAVARTTRSSLFMVLQAGVAALLSKLGAGTDIPIGTPVAGRTDDALDDLVGFFVNTLVLRTDTSGDPSFRELVERVRAADLSAYANQDLPFERLVEIVNPARSLARHPLFQVMLAVQNTAEPDLGVPGLEVGEQEARLGTAKFDLLFSFGERRRADGTPDGLAGAIEFATDLFDRGTAESLAARLVRLLTHAAADPLIPVGRIDVLDPAERHRALVTWNDTAHPVPDTTLTELFGDRTGDARVAVVDEGATLTYEELDAASARLANLLRERGARRGTFVAVAVPRSADLLVTLLAVLRTGAAYLPLDLDHPAERLAFVLDDAKPALVVTVAGTALADTALVLDDSATIAELAAQPTRAPVDGPLPGSPAYLIYTSGSTGRPKGVVVPHRGIVNRLLWMRDHYGITEDDRVLQKTPAGFDVSVWEFFLPMSAGAAQVVARPGGHRDPAYLAALIRDERVTTVHFVPSMLAAFLAEPTAADCVGLHRVICSGEALSADLRDRFAATLGAELHNLYGPTEASVDVTAHEATETPTATVPIGTPVWNTRVHVLDAHLDPVPPGSAGELYLGGVQLAHGYLDRPGLTAERFVADPHGPDGARLYRTGDLARRDRDGVIEFLGRVDDQVKIRGFRIELGEVTAALAAHPDVTRAAVIARPARSGGDQLVAYFTGPAGLDPAVLRKHLGSTLPEHMVPSAFVRVDEFPVTPNGKLDRRALPEPEVETAARGRRPRTPVERTLCLLFAEVLGVPEVTIDDDFFLLGGHSLAATRLVSMVRAEFGVELPIRAVFADPTVAGLTDVLAIAGLARQPLAPAERPQRMPLSYAQARLWFLNRLEGMSSAYNLHFVVRISRDFDLTGFRAALVDVVARHETLRTVFPDTGDGTEQLVLPAEGARVPLSVAPCAEDDLLDAVNTAVSRGFDLTEEIPLRAHLLELPDERVLVLVLHHIAVDGWSLEPLRRDLFTAYNARRAGAAPDWVPLPVQYADYTLWQREVLGDEDDPGSAAARQIAYWTKALDGLPEEIALPTDRPRPPVSEHRAARVDIEVDAATHRGLAALARESRASVFMAVQAGLAALLTRLGAGVDIPVGSPIAGRTDAALDDLVGMFVNTLVLRTDTAGDPTARELLARVRAADLAAYEHQDLPFERLVEVLNPARSLSRNPLFQVMLTFADPVRAGAVAEPDGMRAGPLPTADAGAKCDLSVNLGELLAQDGAPAGLTGTLEYSLDLFDPATAEELVRRLVRVLAAMAEAPDEPISRLAVLSDAEWARLTEGPVFVLDAGLDPVAPGVVGELYRADPVAAGVWHDPAATATRFVACPFRGPGARMHRTGDLARWDGTGALLLAGRAGGVAAAPAPVAGRAPSTDVERVLCRLFAEHLGVESVTADDSFFDLGGYSLLAVRLVSAIRAEFGAGVTLRTLFDAPTVAELAARLGGGESTTSFDVLLPLRKTGSGPPVFCVHPLGGLSWLYSGLAQHLPGRPLYGLQARGIGRDEPLPEDLTAMARDYVARIRAVQPHGPYHLLGWSLGGAVAHAMTALLEQDGHEVALLAVLDAYPVRERETDAGYDEQEFLDGILRFCGIDPATFGDGPLSYADVVATLRTSGSALSDLDDTRLRSLHRVMANSHRIGGAPTSHHCAADVLLFTATVDAAGDPDAWREHTGGAVEVHPIACRHDELMSPDAIAEIGSAIARKIA